MKINIRSSIDIDSLKLRIPLSLVTITDSAILDHYVQVNESTGEVDTETYKRKFKEYNYSETSKVKIGIENRVTRKGEHTECLMIYLNSKALKRRYFEGITIDNIKAVYDDLMSLNAFKVEYENFLRSDCTDIDFKLDEQMNIDEWNELLGQFEALTIPSKRADKGYKRFRPTKDNPYNNGLQYNERNKASATAPFLKLYHKGGELLTTNRKGSNDFKKEYFDNVPDEDLLQIVRIETTIKNKRHANLLGIESVTLLGLLSLTHETKVKAFKHMLGKYIERPKLKTQIEKPKDDTMTPDQITQYTSMQIIMEYSNLSVDKVIEALIEPIEDRNSRYRKKKSLEAIYERYIKGNKTDIRIEKVNSFFKTFNWS